MINDSTPGNRQPDFEPDPRALAAKLERAQVSVPELWTYYYGIGGNVDELALDAYLNGMVDLPSTQVSLIHTAINEMKTNGI
jgi:hypothetical protein